MSERQLRWYTVWSDEHSGHPPEQMQEYRASEAASAWFNAHWCSLGRPDETRVHVRCASGKVLVYDVFVEDIELDLGVTFVESEKPDSQPTTAAALDRAERATG